LVESLSTNWGTDLADAAGKTVWVEIDTTAPGAARGNLERPSAN
jgi:hypothetical protein